MTYSGNLTGSGFIVTLDHSTKAGKTYTIFSNGSTWSPVPASEVRIYDNQYLAFDGVLPLPDFFVPSGNGGKSFKSQGYFGFFNSEGSKYYVLVKAESGTGALNEWAIATLDVD